MAKQAEAERERRAKIVNAEGEFQAAKKMVQAAALISKRKAKYHGRQIPQSSKQTRNAETSQNQ